MKPASLLQVVLTFLLFILSTSGALADRRVALLIGNATYREVARLSNPGNDVIVMRTVLQTAGFDSVEVAQDLDRAAMIKALRRFEDETGSADIAVIYYSGHGIELNGSNYLLPVDAQLGSDRDVEDETVSLDRVLRTISGAKRLKLVILDACRNNPFVPRMVRSNGVRAVDRGLGRVEPSGSDMLVAFAAKAGTTASDGDETNSPYTAALARWLTEPGTDIRLALGNVRDDVLKATGGKQEPFVYGSLGGSAIGLSKASFEPNRQSARTDSGSSVIANQCQDAAPHWAAAQKFDRPEFYQAHLAKFGGCAFADFARARIEELTTAALKPAKSSLESDKPQDNSRPRLVYMEGYHGATFVKGVFKRVGAKAWEETNSLNGTLVLHFETVEEDQNSILLFDSSRDMYFRMDLRRRSTAWRLRDQKTWNPLYAITQVE
jgi:uncharacterized caspase-like protein